MICIASRQNTNSVPLDNWRMYGAAGSPQNKQLKAKYISSAYRSFVLIELLHFLLSSWSFLLAPCLSFNNYFQHWLQRRGDIRIIVLYKGCFKILAGSPAYLKRSLGRAMITEYYATFSNVQMWVELVTRVLSAPNAGVRVPAPVPGASGSAVSSPRLATQESSQY